MKLCSLKVCQPKSLAIDISVESHGGSVNDYPHLLLSTGYSTLADLNEMTFEVIMRTSVGLYTKLGASKTNHTVDSL